MKVKIFHAGISFMQLEINKWLKENRFIEILDMRVTSVFESYTGNQIEDSGTMLITVFLYRENKKDLHPERKYIHKENEIAGISFPVPSDLPF